MGNKSILMSIQPRWVAEILNGNKTIEVRKKFPKDYAGWVYIYCTKNMGKHGENQLLNFFKGNEYFIGRDIDKYNPNDICYLGQNGKVVARFWCDKVEEIKIDKGVMWRFGGHMYITDSIYDATKLLRYSCLEQYQLENYLQGKIGYAIHISKLEVFDNPRRINDFIKYNKNHIQIDNCVIGFGFGSCERLTNAPQSWCYIEGE